MADKKTLHEIAAEYRVCDKTFRRRVRELGIPHIKLGREMLFVPEKVERYLEELTRSNVKANVLDFKPKPSKKITKQKRAGDRGRYASMVGL